jgi:hypothetical protein
VLDEVFCALAPTITRMTQSTVVMTASIEVRIDNLQG